MTACPKCHAPIGAKARFCGVCGSEIALPASAPDSAASAQEPAADQILAGKWKLVRALPARAVAGRKEKSLLWEAQDTGSGARVTIQLIPPALVDDPAKADELKRVCDLWAKIDHPAVVKLSAVELEPVPFLVIEHVDAVSLEELLTSRTRRSKDSPFSPDELSALLPPVGQALDHLAERGLPHGAVEPGHVLVPDSRTGPAARITHPGVGALLRDLATPPNKHAELLGQGTPLYTALEQREGKPADRRTDVHGLAVTVAHLVTGRHPLVAGSGDPLALVPGPLKPVLEKGMSVSPDSRPSTHAAFVKEIAQAVRQLPPPPGAEIENTVRMVAGAPRPALQPQVEVTARQPVTPPPPANEDVEKTVRYVPGMADGAMASTNVTAGSAQAARAPATPAPRATPPPVSTANDAEKTVRFVPGMLDQSMAKDAAKPAAAPPPPPARAFTPPPMEEAEKTIRFVPGMTDASQAKTASATSVPSVPPPVARGPGSLPGTGPGSLPGTGPGSLPGTGPSSLPGTGPSSLPGTGPASVPPAQAADGTPGPDQPAAAPEKEPSSAVFEWVLILVLGLIALWQIVKTIKS